MPVCRVLNVWMLRGNTVIKLRSVDMYSAKRLCLLGVTPFATGGHRLCFRHPHDPWLCIKVNRDGLDRALWLGAPWYKRLFRTIRSFNDNWCEYLAFQQPAIQSERKGVQRHIPHCYGWQDTDLGPGLVTDFFGDQDGLPSPTLDQYLQDNAGLEGIRDAIVEFNNFLLTSRVITKNILPHNLLVVSEAGCRSRLVLIDGFGCLSILPVARCSWLSYRYVARRLQKMELRLRWEINPESLSWEDFQKRCPREKWDH